MTKRWPHIRPLTDEEEAEIQRAIADDQDAWEASEDELREVYTFSEFRDLLRQQENGSGNFHKPDKASVK